MSTMAIDTPHGSARAHIYDAASPRGVLVLGHGAGGGIGAEDLVEAKDVALAGSLGVALVEQPYRVAGRRSPPPAPHLDTCWLAVVGGTPRPLVPRAAPRRRRAVVGRQGRLPHRPPDRCRRRPVPCIPAPAATRRATHAQAKPSARARHRASRGAHSPGRERPLRDPACRAAPHRLRRPGRPQPAPRPRQRSAGRCGMAAACRCRVVFPAERTEDGAQCLGFFLPLSRFERFLI